MPQAQELQPRRPVKNVATNHTNYTNKRQTKMTNKDESVKSESVLRIAAAADLHCTKTSVGQLSPLLARMTEGADILLLCGDLTDFGLPEEAQVLVRELIAVKAPILAVLGNHDYESGKQDEIRKILTDGGVRMLDGDACEIKGVGFAGVKGFAGGFGRATLGAWGEDIIKRFVQEAMNETMKLEAALARLRMPQRIALLHYSPIQATVEGEPAEIFAFLGCGRLAEPLQRYGVTAVFHGHAHRGTPEGKTSGGIPVYNVSLPLMKRLWPDRPPCRILEIPVSSIHEEAASGKGTSVL
jgi:Icc-related predicted phosphoesterase